MIRKRLLKPKTKPSRAPKTPGDWDSLMRKVIARATQLGDRRLEGLRGVILQGKSERYLRQQGIVCEADIQREFSDLK